MTEISLWRNVWLTPQFHEHYFGCADDWLLETLQTSVQETMQPFSRSSQQSSDFHCAQCGKHYLRKASLSRHLKFECGKEPQFQCMFCPKTTKQKSNLDQHMRLCHFDLFQTNSK